MMILEYSNMVLEQSSFLTHLVIIREKELGIVEYGISFIDIPRQF